MSTEPADGTPRNPYRVNAPEDILSLIPHTLGFEPRSSLVFLALCGGRVGATLRVDLPPGAAAKSGANGAYAATAARFLASDTEADGVLMAMYTDAPWRDPAHPPYRPLVRRLEKELAAAGVPLQDGWLVGPETWRDYFCTRTDCCPWPGTPRSRIADSRLNTELVYRGSAFAASIERAVGESFPGQWTNHQEVAAAQARFAEQLAGQWCERQQFQATLEAWSDCFGGTPTASGAHGDRLHSDPEGTGFLLASLGDRGIRDALLVLAAVGKGPALEGAEANGMLRRQDHPPVRPGGAPRDAFPAESGTVPLPPRPRRHAAADFRSLLVGRGPAAPDWARLDRAHAVFTDLVPAAEGDARAGLLSLLAWIEWARGRGSRAHVYLERALEACPGYRLALLLRELLGTGVLPDWARTREGSWPGNRDG
ncbi:DUF4192 domain-containing protein [Arthrobacter sp. zg-Y877]|uniref:DUF4192 domain-containing protein n=1 Tax=Arthrobacter sp. zg-Y877 TaxID=3049074 RepID=UPI0025A48AC5|nr:DUF4192 domain-containing protein [Arthrobacter sp. zg-Y877]MDM7988953.1 DUF4192 domain-containing protein [Arthrobacter sp. zg-Y877]